MSALASAAFPWLSGIGLGLAAVCGRSGCVRAHSLGYPLMVVLFIRAGEKLHERFGPRRPMIWGSLLIVVAAALLMSTNLLLTPYRLQRSVVPEGRREATP